MSRTTAVHEAGPAVLAAHLGIPIKACSLVRLSDSAGRLVAGVPAEAITPAHWLTVLLGGPAAEARVANGPVPAVHVADDWSQARTWAAIITRAAPDSTAVADCLTRHTVLADAIVELQWRWIADVADALQRFGRLDEFDILNLRR